MKSEPEWDAIDAIAERFIALQIRQRCGCTFEQYLANAAYYEKRLGWPPAFTSECEVGRSNLDRNLH